MNPHKAIYGQTSGGQGLTVCTGKHLAVLCELGNLTLLCCANTACVKDI